MNPNWEDLKPGHRYRVEFEDCCVQGEFTATFVEMKLDDEGDEGDEGEPWAAIFDTARITNSWGPWTFTELKSTQ